ncbi:hypothetical protein MUU74_17050 [Chryseobacterium daecheongense]|uniref:hypothetical protein n=1 Tax=Chryseobacterium daecheongense TaxID=192389 RepID=UPI001FD6E07F|nr:hypothetical protein [Chryseobacterium daecheongense]UOU98187.1 hypothetical protein MUU74_17050 [Chryseobacterium daecheongense]
MKKAIYILLLILVSSVLFGQTPEIKTDLPKIIPPSPTVASLMKFEEVPVSNYTGTPEVVIPLINLPTHSKDISLNISLKYHPSNVKADNVAGETGLGWSVLAGGTVSRVVKGIPDEELTVVTSSQPGKVGLYHTTLQNHKNIYYDYISNPAQYVSNNQEAANEYYWETVENGKYDTEHDLWQFNFMGQTGRFFIKKYQENLIIEPLSDYRVKIINHYGTINGNAYVPTGFTIYDEQGYRYEFEEFEITRNAQFNESLTMIRDEYSTNSSQSEDKEFRSAFQLTKVYDNNNKLIFSINYNPADLIEVNKRTSITVNEYGEDGISAMRYANCFSEIKPLKITSTQFTKVNVKKIQSILVTDFGRVDFKYKQGRSDSNISAPQSVAYLDKIELYDWDSHLLNTHSFTYEYIQTLENRMFLKNLKKEFPNSSVIEKHEFFYKKSNLLLGTLGKDYWGYFNTSGDNCQSQDATFMNEPTPGISSLDLLQKIKYPTGGSVVLYFESNQYSYIGDQPVTEFLENPLNTESLGSTTLSFNNNTLQYLPIYNKDRKVKFTPSIIQPDDPADWTRTFRLLKIVNGQPVSLGAVYCTSENGNCCKDFVLEKNVQYALRRDNFDINYSGTDTMGIEYTTSKDNPNQYLFGGGNRIAKIGYFEGDVDQDFYENHNNSITPQKEKRYSYDMISEPGKSSGSLVFGKPLFYQYRSIKQMGTTCPLAPFLSLTSYDGTYVYLSKTNSNSQEMVSTQGSEVGYKNVKVFELNKGSIEHTYTSPLDYPEDVLIVFQKPYLPSKNIDYKRGLLLNEIIRDNTNKLLTETTNTYDFINYEKEYGYKFDEPDGVGFDGTYFSNYDGYKYYLGVSTPFLVKPGCPAGQCDETSRLNLPGFPISYVNAYKVSEAYGWSRLISKESKSYFYEGSTQKVIQRNEAFEYNTINKRISTHTVNKADGGTLTTLYYYHTGNSAYSQNRIAEIEKIESYKNNTLIDSKKIVYDNSWGDNVSYLPKQIQSAVGAQTLETNVTFNKYDALGNLLQYTTKEGIPVSIVWGYQKTQPIAKVEGIAYADLENLGLISTIVSASDSDASNPANEGTLITALNNFRNNSALQNYQITTLTHNPLIGVTTMIPPSGIKETYQYDNANRLEKLMDEEGKIVKEFKYNYKQ